MWSKIGAMALCLLMASSAAAGDYGTLNLDYQGRQGPYMGNGGRFDWDIKTGGFAPNSEWNPNWRLQKNAPGDRIYTFCIELTEGVGDADFMMDKVTDAQFEELADRYFQTAANNTDKEAGAFQLALWELVHGDGDIDNGIVSQASNFTGSAIDLADDYLDSLTGTYIDLTTTAIALTYNGRQDQLMQVTLVPEASSVVVWSMMALGLGCCWYQRRKDG